MVIMVNLFVIIVISLRFIIHGSSSHTSKSSIDDLNLPDYASALSYIVNPSNVRDSRAMSELLGDDDLGVTSAEDLSNIAHYPEQMRRIAALLKGVSEETNFYKLCGQRDSDEQPAESYGSGRSSDSSELHANPKQDDETNTLNKAPSRTVGTDPAGSLKNVAGTDTDTESAEALSLRASKTAAAPLDNDIQYNSKSNTFIPEQSLADYASALSVAKDLSKIAYYSKQVATLFKQMSKSNSNIRDSSAINTFQNVTSEECIDLNSHCKKLKEQCTINPGPMILNCPLTCNEVFK